jgi:hypothetical protein
MMRIAAAASFLRFMAVAVSRAWIFMFSRVAYRGAIGPSPMGDADGSAQPVEGLGGAVGAFDPPSVAGVDRVLVISPGRTLTARADDGSMVGHDVNPARGGSVRKAALLERAARAVPPTGRDTSGRTSCGSGASGTSWRGSGRRHGGDRI